MLFVTLIRFRRKPTKADLERTNKELQSAAVKAGSKIISFYWTLGRYDAVLISECPDEKTHMKIAIQFGDLVSTESMVAIPRAEAEKLV